MARGLTSNGRLLYEAAQSLLAMRGLRARQTFTMAKHIHRRRDPDPGEGIEKYRDATFADPTNNKYPIDTPGRIKAALCERSRLGFGGQPKLGR
jgi:hypothetical protein